MEDQSRFTYMTLDSQEFGISQSDYDAFLIAVAEHRQTLERDHGERWVALLDQVDERSGRPARVVVRFAPASEVADGADD